MIKAIASMMKAVKLLANFKANGNWYMATSMTVLIRAIPMNTDKIE